jgi:hypothetical protein
MLGVRSGRGRFAIRQHYRQIQPVGAVPLDFRKAFGEHVTRVHEDEGVHPGDGGKQGARESTGARTRPHVGRRGWRHRRGAAARLRGVRGRRTARWFIDLKDLNDLWKPHPRPWKVPMRLDGGKLFGSEARRAISRGWCRLTKDLAGQTLREVVDCDKSLPYPNGGCRSVRVGSALVYTFGDALK